MADKLSPFIQGYRAKETLPKTFNLSHIIDLAQGAGIAVQLGMPKIGVDTLINRILKEGREDAGLNSFNTNNKQATDLYDKMKSLGQSDVAAQYAAAVLDKSQVAKRLNISFDRAWNGTGISKNSGKSGQDYSDEMQASSGAIEDPRNANFKDLISRAASGNLTPTEAATQVSWDTLRKVFAGVDNSESLTQEDKYTPKALAGIKSNLETQISKLNLTGARADAVRSDLRDPAELLNMLPAIWQDKAGLEVKGRLGMASYTPDTINVINSMLGY